FTTKALAEAALRQLPSVIGASVREDIHGHPREIHLLVAPGPNPRDLARTGRKLLQERLGIEIDQRVISIAQLARELDQQPSEAMLAIDTAPDAESAPNAPANAAPALTAHDVVAEHDLHSSPPAAETTQAQPDSGAAANMARVIYQGVE